MKKINLCLLLLIVYSFLAGCGSAGDAEDDADELEELFHNVELVKTDTANQLKIAFAKKDDNVVHLVKDGKVANVAIGEIAFISVEGSIIGYLPTAGKKVAVVDISNVTIDGVSADDSILISVFTKNGEKLFVNSDHVKFIGAKMVVNNGLMYYGLAADNPNFSYEQPTVIPPVTPPATQPSGEPLHSFAVTGSTASITFATIDGYIINVVKDGISTAVRANDIARIVWCGDIAGWDTSVNKTYKSALTLPTTSFNVPMHDIGIVMLVTLDGSVYSLNTAKTQLPVGNYLDGRSLIVY